MVGTYRIVLQSPSYDGTGGNGEQIPLPAARATLAGQSLTDVLNLYANNTISFDFGTLKEGITIQGRMTTENVGDALVREGGSAYQSMVAMRDAVRRTRKDWPSETASGTWGSTGLPSEEQDGSTSRATGKVRLIYGDQDQNNDGTLALFFLYGFVQNFQFQRKAPTHRERNRFNITFVPSKNVIAI